MTCWADYSPFERTPCCGLRRAIVLKSRKQEGNSHMSKMVAEFIGTFTLVLFGCGAAVIAGADGTTGIGLAGISFAFGLALIGMAYGIGSGFGLSHQPGSVAGCVSGRPDVDCGHDPVLDCSSRWRACCCNRSARHRVGAAGWDGGLGANGWVRVTLVNIPWLPPLSLRSSRRSCSWS